MQIIDKDAKTWFAHLGAFRAPSPDGHIFEPGVKYRMHQTEWMKAQPTIVEVKMEDDLDDIVLKPHETRTLQIGQKPEEAEAAAAAADAPAKK